MSNDNESGSRGRGLWGDSDFLKLWGGQTISLLGSQVTALAFPLTAVITFRASSMQLGALVACQYAPALLFGLFAGVWVDRMRRRPVLILTNVARGVLLGAVPAAALLGLLRIEHLYVLSLLTGALAIFFEVAYLSYLPTLIRHERLLEGNSKLQLSASASFVAGPGLAGLLVQWLTAPLALAVDAASFFISAAFFGAIRRPEPARPPGGEPKAVREEIAEGFRAVGADPVLRAIVSCTTTSNFFINMLVSIRLLYAARDLNLQPATIGFLFAAGSLGSLAAAACAGRISRSLGVGPTVIVMQLLVGVSALIIPLAGGGFPVMVATITGSLILWGFAMTTYDITQISYRQAVAPHRLLGRLNASIRFLAWGASVPGALLGGVMGEALGLRATLLVSAAGVLGASLWTLFSPARHLRQMPAGTTRAP
ncbi:MAG TPA: MFS transporter [Pyrinomonadaceae bacterium]|jgi:MFS family permease